MAAVGFALLATTALPALAEARPLVTGLSGLENYSPLAIQQAKATGIQLVRISVPWEDVAPAKKPTSWQPEDPADPNYNWSAIDAAVTTTVEAGLTPVITIEGAPLWAQRCQAPGAPPGRLCEPEPSALAAFAIAAATRYSGLFEGLPQVRYWQGLNEPNLSLYFNPQYEDGKAVSPQLYRKLINAFYFAIKSVNSSDLVIAAGLGPVAVQKLTIGPMNFARLLLCMRGSKHPSPTTGNCEGGLHFDIFDVHPYTTGGPKHEGEPENVELGSLGRLQTLLAAADRAGRIHSQFKHTELWATEFSWDSKPPDPGGLPMSIETRWTAEALHQAWLAGVSHFFWFQLCDEARDGRPAWETIESGLYFRGATIAKDRPKELMYAFRFPFVAYSERSGFSFWGRTPTSTGGKVVIEVQKGSRWQRAAVASANSSGIFNGAARTTYGREDQGAVRASYGRETAIPFSLHPVKEFYQSPFGNQPKSRRKG